MASEPPSKRYLAARGLLPNPVRRSKKPTHEIYFIRAVTLGLIKIGKARNARSRFAKMRAMSPDILTILGVIPCNRNGALEAELHRRFAAHRAHGEWFRPADELLAYIRENVQSPQARTDWRVERKKPLKRARVPAA